MITIERTFSIESEEVKCKEVTAQINIETKRFRGNFQVDDVADDLPELVSDSESDCDDDGESTKPITSTVFNQQRAEMMRMVVKYVAYKISTKLPTYQCTCCSQKLSLDGFLMALCSRLAVNMNTFQKTVIYLFRYIDIVFFLRYINQSNNFINYNEVGCIRKFIVACFKLSMSKETQTNTKWELATGLQVKEIDEYLVKLVRKLNNRVSIKDTEMKKLNFELYRFVKCVSK